MTQLAEVREFHELVAVLKGRMLELNITMGTIDAIAGLPDRFCSKIFCSPRPLKGFGPISLGAIIQALGLDRRLWKTRSGGSQGRGSFNASRGPRCLPFRLPFHGAVEWGKVERWSVSGLCARSRARAARLVPRATPAQRSRIAREAALARWQSQGRG